MNLRFYYCFTFVINIYNILIISILVLFVYNCKYICKPFILNLEIGN